MADGRVTPTVAGILLACRVHITKRSDLFAGTANVPCAQHRKAQFPNEKNSCPNAFLIFFFSFSVDADKT